MRRRYIHAYARMLVIAIMALLPLQSALSAALQPGTNYYIWLNIYEKLLGSNGDGTSPALSAFGTNAEAETYQFKAEDSGTNGYVLLRQVSSGKYLAASSSSSYNVVFESAKSTDARYLWVLSEGTYTYLVNKKNGKYLGIDGANKGKDYVSVYYDKPKGSHSQFTAIPTQDTDWQGARRAYEGEVYTNAQGVNEIDYCQIYNRTVDRSDDIDIHITANATPILGSSIVNLGSDRTWLIFDNIPAGDVASTYLRYVRINGTAAKNGTNCRVVIFLNGAAVIPIPSAIMTCQGTNGEFTLGVGSHLDLKKQSNAMTSFTLRRGYMATLASGKNDGGYSRVYVADHADLEITLPTPLYKRVTSVYVKPWQYLSKKGWGNTSGASQGNSLRASWFWSWSAGYSSTSNMEFVPCRQHRFWPSANEVNNKTSTAAFSLNEPEHSEQHTSSKCSCGGTINEWTAYGITSDFKASGGRIGSPQPTDFSYLTNYFKYVDNMQNRCDFAVTHAYWDIGGRSESGYASYFVDHCKEVWNNTGRPLWITELEIGSSWGESWSGYSDKYGTYRKYLQVLLQKMEECGWIERYCIYGFDNYWSWMFYKDGGITPAGQVYRDHRSTFAYNAKYTKVPTFWAPSAKTPSLDVSPNITNNTVNFTVTNPNTDMTDRLIIEREMEDGSWVSVYEETDRSLFESTTVKITGIDATDMDLENDRFRVTILTLNGITVNSSGAASGYIKNPTIETDSKTDISHWTCSMDAQNGYTKATGDTYFEVWSTTGKVISFNYFQDIEEELPDGVYSLKANVFNSSNGEEGASVNATAGLYAQTSNQLYFQPVTKDSELDTTSFLTIDSIVVTDGKLQVGIRNLGEMNARWVGADNFQLSRIGDVEETEIDSLLSDNEQALYALMPEISGAEPDDDGFTPRDASRFIVNPDCNRTTSYGWNVTNIDYDKANPFNGDASAPYWNIWKGSAFSSSMSQDISGLPQGYYELSILTRASTNANLSLTASTSINIGNDAGETLTDTLQTQTATTVGKGTEAVEGSNLPSGWFEMRTEPVFVGRGERLSISFSADLPASGWWSADHFQLTLTSIPHEEPAEHLTGDVNQDGAIDISDIVAIINQIAGTANYEHADVNQDQKVDISDIVAVINIIAGQSAQAQHEYQPFLKLGKKWHCQVFSGQNGNDWESHWIDYYYEVKEKIEKGSSIYYNIVCDNSDNYDFDYWFRETDGKVYRSDQPGQDEQLVYDFLADEGETCVFQAAEGLYFSLTKEKQTEMVLFDIPRYIIDNDLNAYIAGPSTDGENTSDIYNWGNLTIVEGIGNLMNPFDFYAAFTDMYPPRLIECFEGETCVFSQEDYQKITTSVESTYNNDRNAKEANGIFDLSGRRLSATPSKGLFIMNGKILFKR